LQKKLDGLIELWYENTKLLYKHTVKNRLLRMACMSLKKFLDAVALVKYWLA